jgi:arginase
MDALAARDPESGLLYVDRHFDLNTPDSTTDGALDWMGLGHALDLPGAAPELAAAFGRRPLLAATQLQLVGVAPAAATAFELEQAARIGLGWRSSDDLAAAPADVVEQAVARLPAGTLAVHVDVDVLDFTDAPLSENTDGRNTGPTLEALDEALEVACRDARFRVLSIGEINPGRCAGSPEVLQRFVGSLTRALRPR